MKKNLWICISLVFLFVFIGSFTAIAQEFSGGDGTPENPYQVATAEDLDNVRNFLDADFVQTADIDLVGTEEWVPIGQPGSMFSGSYDGDHHVITNVTISQPEDFFVGLFGYLAGDGEILNLGVEDVTVTGDAEVGGLVGSNSGIIDNCYTTGTVSGLYKVGGMVGNNEDGQVRNSYTMVTVAGEESSGGLAGYNSGSIYNCYATGPVSGEGNIGGLVGLNDSGGAIWASYATGDVDGEGAAGGLVGINFESISNCYATGSVTGIVESNSGYICIVGGLVGLNGFKEITDVGEEVFSGVVENSYAVGFVSGGDYVGGLIGSQGFEYSEIDEELVGSLDIGEVENSFWNTDINAIGLGSGDDIGATGKNTVEMETKDTFIDAGWDFDTIWAMEEGEYPDLLMGDYAPDIEIDQVFIQYRTQEDENNNMFRGWVGLSKNGLPVEENEIEEIIIMDSQGNEISTAYGGFWYNENYIYDCLSGSCSISELDFNSGYYGGFEGDLPEDDYQIEIETVYGSTVTTEVYYPGKLELPVVSSATMDAGYENGELVLRWTNPENQDNWDEVDRLRIVLFDDMNHEILYVEVDTEDDSAAIPADIIEDAEAIHDTNFTKWHVQTRAIDENGMNYARGNSDQVDFGYSIQWPFIQYRTYENEAMAGHNAWIGVTKNGRPIEENDVTDISVIDPDNGELALSREAFWAHQFYSYNCYGQPCNVSGLIVISGFSVDFESTLDEGIYDVELQTADNQTVAAEIEYPGILELPMVKSASMEADFENGDLRLQWDNPVNEERWEQVQQLTIILLDNLGDYILSITVEPTEESVTVPAHILEQAESLRDTDFTTWLIQTRANDENYMNYARGYSDAKDFTIDDPPADDPQITQDNEVVESGTTVSNNSDHSGVIVYEGGSVNNYATLSDLENYGSVNGGIVSGSSSNEGSLNNVALDSATVLDNKGGTFSGESNEGQVFGGTLEGDIANDGVISGLAPNGEPDPDYAVIVASGASVSGGTMEGSITNMGTIDNVTFEANTAVFFPNWSEGEPGILTGTLTFRDDTGIEFVIEIPTDTVFPDPDTIPESGLVLDMQHILDYALDQGWFDGEEMASSSLMHAENSDTAMPENEPIPAIPDEYALVGGVVLSETGAHSLNAAGLVIPYEPWEIPDGYSEADLKALVYDYDEKQWGTVPSENTGENELKISTSSITAYAVVVDDTAEPDEPDSETGSGSSSTCFIRTLF